MKRTFKEALEHRRSYYTIGSDLITTRRELEDMVAFALKHVPSAFNSQSTRIMLLLGKEHKKLWTIVKDCLKTEISAEAFERSEQKIDHSFTAGSGTLLFWEDREVVIDLMKNYPLYETRFQQWSQHTSAMHQLALWCMLEDSGYGASLQHYNPLIDERVRGTWNVPEQWELIAQMPFGYPLAMPGPKSFEAVETRMWVIGE